MPQRVLGDGPGNHELRQIIRPAGLGTGARQLEPAKRLTIDQGAGDLAIDVEIPDSVLAPNALDVRRAARKQAAGQGIARRVGDAKGIVEVAGLDDGENRAENLLA